MLKSKKAVSLLLSLMMVFAFSVNALAVGQDQVDIRVYVNDVLDLNNSKQDQDINAGDTVEDLVKSAYVGQSTWSGSWMTSLLGYSSAPYIAYPSCFDEDGYYIGGDPILDSITQYGGVEMDASDMLGAPGYYIMGDGQHMLYLGSDWTFQIDYAADGIGNPVTPGNGSYQYTMGQAELADGDVVYLNYGFNPTFF